MAGQARGRRVRAVLIALEVGAGGRRARRAPACCCAACRRVGRVDAGFVAERLLTLNVVLVAKGEGPARADAVRLIVERVAAVPGVEAAGGATGLPPQTAQRGSRYELEGVTPVDGPRPSAYFIADDARDTSARSARASFADEPSMRATRPARRSS